MCRAKTESTVSGSGPETFSPEPEPTQGVIGFLGKLLLRSQRSVDTRTRPQTAQPALRWPGAQTGNLNRPLIVLTSSSWINIVDLVKLPKHQPSLIRPLARCYGCQPGVMPTHNLME